jgi:hypoxanthine phosphoribosyltransferase
MNLPKSNVVFSAEEIQARIKELGAQITAEFNDDKPIVCVCVLRGAVMFFADLMKYIDSDKVTFDFVTLQSYETAMEVGGMQTTGKIKLIQDMREKVEGKHVLVVEDIVDSGNTVNYLHEYFASKNALDVKIACLLDKPMARKVPVVVDYVAFTLERPAYIIGYGLDSNQQYRNLNAIYEVITD